MNGLDFIQAKQTSWANRNNIKLVGSQTTKGANNYTEIFEDNFFEKLSLETKKAFESGDGGELRRIGNNLPKMSALHSSSALGVNIFQYWSAIHKEYDIAYALGLCSKGNKKSNEIKFEEKFVINDSFPKSPNIDVVIKNTNDSKIKAFGIECKFSEAYSSRQPEGLKEKYLNKIGDQWDDIPNLKKFAKENSQNANGFKFLHSAQLIKHILGLKKKYGKSNFRLLYLWYDVYGDDGANHREEIEKFKMVTKSDNIMFHSISYQELMVKMAKHFYIGNEKYIDYITDRYL